MLHNAGRRELSLFDVVVNGRKTIEGCANACGVVYGSEIGPAEVHGEISGNEKWPETVRRGYPV